jgi:hypothetical protein
MAAGEEDVEERLDDVAEAGLGTAGGAELIELIAPSCGQSGALAAEQGWNGERVVSRRHKGVRAREQVGACAVVVDGEVVDDRFHGEGEGVLELAPGAGHDFLESGLGFGFAVRSEDEAHATATHAAQHAKAPEIGTESSPGLRDERFGVMVGGPGDDGLNGKFEVAGGGGTDGGDIAAAQGVEDFLEDRKGLLTGLPFGGGAEQILLSDHLENGSDVLGHTPVHKDEALLETCAGVRRAFVGVEDAVMGHEAAAADLEFGVGLGGGDTGDEFHAGPEAAAVLPTAAGAPQPFAEQGTGKHDTAFVVVKRAGERLGLTGGAHAGSDQGREEVRGDGEARAFGDVVDAADDFEAAAGAADAGEQTRQLLAAAFKAGRNDPAGDDRGLEEAKVVTGKIEDVVQMDEISGGAEIHTGQAEKRFVDDAEVRLDGGLGSGIAAMDAQVDRDVKHAGTLGVVHAQEENVAPTRVSEVHSHRRALAEDWIRAIEAAGEEFGFEAQGLVCGMTGAEHPLVAADAAHAAADLVGKGLEGEAMVGDSEGTAKTLAGAGGAERVTETLDGFLETALEEMLESREWDELFRVAGAGISGEQRRKVKPMDRVKEEQGSDTFVEVGALSAKLFEGIRGFEKGLPGQAGQPVIKGLVANIRVRARDQFEDRTHE